MFHRFVHHQQPLSIISHFDVLCVLFVDGKKQDADPRKAAEDFCRRFDVDGVESIVAAILGGRGQKVAP